MTKQAQLWRDRILGAELEQISLAQMARENGVAPAVAYRWRQRLGAELSAPEAFIKVERAAPPTQAETTRSVPQEEKSSLVALEVITATCRMTVRSKPEADLAAYLLARLSGSE